jgi:hypothetical protein
MKQCTSMDTRHISSHCIEWLTWAHPYGMYHKSASTSSIIVSIMSLVFNENYSFIFRFREHMAGVHGEKDFHFDHAHGDRAAGARPHR